MKTIKRVAQMKTAAQFAEHLQSIGADLPFEPELEIPGPLCATANAGNQSIGNRFSILPMEGWDGTTDGFPTDLTIRRWQRFGQSGAKLIWGGEAVSVRPDGRANPNQLMMNKDTLPAIAGLRETLVQAHQETMGNTDDLCIGLQLTHSGRFARPLDKKMMEPRILYRHPILDAKFGIQHDDRILNDAEIDGLVGHFIAAAKLAAEAGFDFVDVKHCHGYLGHEFLTAVDRPGKYGGSLENRTRFLRDVVHGIQQVAPKLQVGVRLSMIDFVPFRPGADRTGEPTPFDMPRYPYAFGGDGTGTGLDLTEPIQLLEIMRDLGIRLVCTTAGSPYYTPHLQRPAIFPPSDGYMPPEEPLLGVARQIAVQGELKTAVPELLYVGSGYSYLQEWLPNVAQAAIRQNLTDFVGLGRMVLSYPDLPADVIAGRPLQTKRICRTFSDCTTAPRNGLISGCYPLDAHYKAMPEAQELAILKKAKS